MTVAPGVSFQAVETDELAGFEGRIALIVAPDGRMDAAARRVNRLSRGAVARMAASPQFAKLKVGQAESLAYPSGLAARAIDVVVLPRRCSPVEARKAGGALAKLKGDAALMVLAGNHARAADIAQGIALRNYRYDEMKSVQPEASGAVTMMVADPDAVRDVAAPLLAVAEGVHLTRDLVNRPANVLTVEAFARQLKEMESLGLKVEVLDEAKLEALGMRTLLAVGQGSDSPSRVVVMHWNGGAKGDHPLALIGKGVVFDTGGISMKPAAGMEDMTMDMGGAGVVAGVMHTLARRKARANVVGLVGLVENMPSGKATRPGDVVRSMKGDTVEIINTDAEGRLVLCDVMWYAQDRFKPAAMIDLATLTGAIIVALGNENAGVFSNDDAFCARFLKAAEAEGEAAWRMPLAQAYDDLLKSQIADMKNVGGRAAGSVTAAQFLKRFVKDGMPWVHLDIAGVASVKTEGDFAPKGATGWGVRALDRLVRDTFEKP